MSEFREDNLTDWAAALTYYTVLSVFPALIALVSIVGLVADPRSLTEALTQIVSDLGPSTASETYRGPIESISENEGAAGVLFVVGLALALWTASGYIGAFMRASNVVYEVEEGRPFWKLRPLQMLVTLAMVVLLALVLVALVLTGPVAKAVGDAVGVGDTAVTIWSIAKWPVLLGTVLLMFDLLYYTAPNARVLGFRWLTPGSALAVAVWVVASVGFAFYVANFGSYDRTYGALGGMITFLVWIWITNAAVLLGAELNSELERSRELATGAPAQDELQLPSREDAKTA